MCWVPNVWSVYDVRRQANEPTDLFHPRPSALDGGPNYLGMGYRVHDLVPLLPVSAMAPMIRSIIVGAAFGAGQVSRWDVSELDLEIPCIRCGDVFAHMFGLACHQAYFDNRPEVPHEPSPPKKGGGRPRIYNDPDHRRDAQKHHRRYARTEAAEAHKAYYQRPEVKEARRLYMREWRRRTPQVPPPEQSA